MSGPAATGHGLGPKFRPQRPLHAWTKQRCLEISDYSVSTWNEEVRVTTAPRQQQGKTRSAGHEEEAEVRSLVRKSKRLISWDMKFPKACMNKVGGHFLTNLSSSWPRLQPPPHSLKALCSVLFLFVVVTSPHVG